MITAIVAFKVDRKRVNDIATELADIDGCYEVYSVTGRYDLIAIVRTKDNQAMASIVTDSMLKIEGIITSETMMAFRTYSKHDLDAMFDIGNP
jgi:DNA-binding Lrp family transcriptional regulator